MVFKGTNKYPTTDDVNIIERYGGLQNAYTDIDVTNYHNKTLSTDWQLALEINKELALAPRLEQQYIDKERDVIIEEMKRYDDEPAAKVEEAFHSMLYPKTKLGMKIIGEETSLRACDATTLRNYHDRWYDPKRIVVVVAGKMTDDQMKKITEQSHVWFSDSPIKQDKQLTKEGFEKVVEKQHTPQLTVVTKKEAQQAHLVLGLRTFGRASEDRFAWNVFNLLMGVSFSSRLFREIREKRGLCYHIRSSSSNYEDVGYWSIYAGVGTQKVQEAVKAIMAELALAKQKGVTEEEITISKKRLKTMIAFKSEDPEFQNEYYGRQELFGQSPMTLDQYLAKIDAVTKPQIDTLIQKYFTQQSLNLSLVWSKPKDDGLVSLLKL
jgi:predicted Zn-dependent peptidase